jgi:cytochrome bd-type quinol oxidase subunit 2
MLFTLAVLSTIAGLAFINGPMQYVKKITNDRKNLINSAVLFGSMIFSLYFSIIAGSYLMSILLCLVELNAVLLFFCNTFPAGQLGLLKSMSGAAVTVVSAPFRR